MGTFDLAIVRGTYAWDLIYAAAGMAGQKLANNLNHPTFPTSEDSIRVPRREIPRPLATVRVTHHQHLRMSRYFPKPWKPIHPFLK